MICGADFSEEECIEILADSTTFKQFGLRHSSSQGLGVFSTAESVLITLHSFSKASLSEIMIYSTLRVWRLANNLWTMR